MQYYRRVGPSNVSRVQAARDLTYLNFLIERCGLSFEQADAEVDATPADIYVTWPQVRALGQIFVQAGARTPDQICALVSPRWQRLAMARSTAQALAAPASAGYMVPTLVDVWHGLVDQGMKTLPEVKRKDMEARLKPYYIIASLSIVPERTANYDRSTHTFDR